MTLAAMKRFRTTPLALRPEPDDVVYAGATVTACRSAAVNASTAATSRGDATGAAQWDARASALATVQSIAPGAVGIRYRDREERLYFFVPAIGLVQSLQVDQFLTEFSGETDTAALYALHARGVEAVYEVVRGWGWTEA